METVRQVGRIALSLIFLLGSFNPFDQAFASDRAEDQQNESPALTIYNERFAVVRQKLPLDLKSDV
jgi:hypothetical protein